MSEETWDVVVAGAGNAGMSAAHAARERGCRVLVLEKADVAWSGGNSAFTAGAIRLSQTASPTCATSSRASTTTSPPSPTSSPTRRTTSSPTCTA